jgi:ABC-type uncharacterized transport system involved in gliding motility auxiliary subunit
MVNILSNNFFARFDLTQNKVFSISQVSKDKLKNLNDILTIELYFSDNLPRNLDKVKKDVFDIIDEFKIIGGKNVRVLRKNPLKNERDKEDAFALDIPAIDVETIEKDKIQKVKGYMGIALRYAGKSENIMLVQPGDNLEYEIIQRLIRLTAEDLPIVGIVKTDTAMYVDPRIAQWYAVEIPEDITHKRFKPIFFALSAFYQVQYIDLSQDTAIIPEISTIIIPGEDEASYFTNPDAIYAIDQYLMRGGNVIVLAQKISINLQKSENASISNTFLYKMLDEWGVDVKNDILIDASCGQINIPQQYGARTGMKTVDYPMFVRIPKSGFNGNVPPLSSMREIIFPWTTPLEISQNLDPETIVDTLIMSSPKSTFRKPPFRITPNQNWEWMFNNAAENELLKQYPIGIRLSGKINSVFSDTTLERPKDKELLLSTTKGSVIVVSNADFLSVDAGKPQNLPLLMNLTDWLTLDNNLISIRSRTMTDRTIDNNAAISGKENNSTTAIKILNMLLMPILIIVAGVILFINRKKQQNGGK